MRSSSRLDPRPLVDSVFDTISNDFFDIKLPWCWCKRFLLTGWTRILSRDISCQIFHTSCPDFCAHSILAPVVPAYMKQLCTIGCLYGTIMNH